MKTFPALFAACLATLLVYATPWSAAAQTRDCAVARVDGEQARYWRDGVWRALGAAALPQGEVIVETGPDTRLEIVCDDGVVVTIGVSTTVSLERLIGEAGPKRNVVLQLLEGVIAAIAPSRTWSRFDIRAPFVIASVRSTEWLVAHDPGEGSAVFVRRGRVAVAAPGERMEATLEPGEGVDGGSGGLGPVKRWSDDRIAEAGRRLGFRWR